MTRIFSGLVLLAILIGVVWFAPAWATLAVGGVVLALATLEYVTLVETDAAPLPRLLVVVATLCAALPVAWWPGMPGEAPLLAAAVAIAGATVGRLRPEQDVARHVAVSLLPMLYLGLPLGAIVALRVRWGPGALFALLATVIASDTAQYYGGRAFGRHRLAPVVSPKKTVEGAVSGLLAGTLVLPLAGRWWLPDIDARVLVPIGAALVALGIVGDLFESLLKRSAGVKDSSGLIPGHGGMLDRIDSLLFAGPVFYVCLRVLL